MSHLRAFQNEIKSLIFYRDAEKDTSFLWKGGVPSRLDVYRNNTRLNWSDALDHDFPLTRHQFEDDAWRALKAHYFIKHPPKHWELNAALSPFIPWLAKQKVLPYVKELTDYEGCDLQVFVHRASVRKGAGRTNPTLAVRVYQHQIFDWVEAGAPRAKPPNQKAEVLAFYRDSANTCHVMEADPLLLLFAECYRKPQAQIKDVELARRKLLPSNHVSLPVVLSKLQADEVIL